MSQEINVNCSLNIRKQDANSLALIAKAYQAGFRDDMSGQRGPTPGVLTANVQGTGGTQVSFAQLTAPKWCWVSHLGRTDGSLSQDGDYVEIGMYDPATHKYMPMLELEAGMQIPLPLSRNLQETYVGPGTGTAAGGENARLLLLAHPVAQNVSVEAYDR